MDRQTVYPGQILPETVLLQMAKDSMIGVAKLSAAMFGTSMMANGFAVTPTGPASLQVVVAPGEIYALTLIDATAFSSLPADTTHSIMKQGILLDAVTLTCAAPGTTGQSINYLVEVTYQDLDANPVLLPYYNSANPSAPFSGLGNNGLTQNTSRKGAAVVQVKAGVPATTGSQTTPAPDSGYVGVYVVTVAYGQTTITSSSISQYIGAPLLPAGIVPAIQSNAMTSGQDFGTSGVYKVNFFPAIGTFTNNMMLEFEVLTANPGACTLSVNGGTAFPVIGAAHAALQGGEFVAGGKAEVIWHSTLASWVLLGCTGGAMQVGTATGSKHAMQLGQATGRLLRTTTYTGGTFTWNQGAGTTAIRVRLQAPGGGGAGSPTTAASQVSVGSGGSAGAYGEGFYTGGSVPASATVTVPVGGAGGIGTNGTNASAASFGALMTAPGGLGGRSAGPSTVPFFANAIGSPATATGGNVFNTTGAGGGATNAISLSVYGGGTGGDSQLGAGGPVPAQNVNGSLTAGYGGGGQGSSAGQSSSAWNGGQGAPAICIVEEYGSI